MAYLTNMPRTCRERSTNPKYPLTLLASVQKEFQKSLAGGIFDATYVREKLESVIKHVEWLEGEAQRERAAEFSEAD